MIECSWQVGGHERWTPFHLPVGRHRRWRTLRIQRIWLLIVEVGGKLVAV
jgi:hypothetical protein